MNYKICGKLRDTGREDIRVVHVDHLIHFETSRAKLFPNYGPAEFKDTEGFRSAATNPQEAGSNTKNRFLHTNTQRLPNTSAQEASFGNEAGYRCVKDDIFASDASAEEVDLQSNITSPSVSKSLEIEPHLVTDKNVTKESSKDSPFIDNKSSLSDEISKGLQTQKSSVPDPVLAPRRYPKRDRKPVDRF